MLLYKLFKLDSDPSWLRPGGAGALEGMVAAPFFLQTLEQSDHLSCCFSGSLQDGLSGGRQCELQLNEKVMEMYIHI